MSTVSIEEEFGIPLGDPSIPTNDGALVGSGEKGTDTPTRKPKRQRGRQNVQPPPLPKSALPKKEPEDSQIEKITSEILSFTAVLHATPMLPDMQCDYCRDHILEQAPKSAKELVKLSHDFPFLRGALVGVTRFFSGVGALSVVTDMYGASVAHHGPEIPVITPMLAIASGGPTKLHPEGMPPRAPKKQSHKGDPNAHSEATAGTSHKAAPTEA